MKIIVSTELFRDALKQAFDVDAHCIKIHPNMSASSADIVFGTRKYQSDITLNNVHISDAHPEVLAFNNLGMAKLYQFLGTLKHQPIVIIIEEETIRCEQFVIDFI